MQPATELKQLQQSAAQKLHLIGAMPGRSVEIQQPISAKPSCTTASRFEDR